jgi:hypothetical protein
VFVNGDEPQEAPLTSSQLGIFRGVEQRTGAVNKGVTCVASVVLPFLPGPPTPDDLSGLILDNGKDVAETAASATEGAAATIRQARRIGPSRLARIAKLERRAERLTKASKAASVASIALAAPEAYKNYNENCK